MTKKKKKDKKQEDACVSFIAFPTIAYQFGNPHLLSDSWKQTREH